METGCFLLKISFGHFLVDGVDPSALKASEACFDSEQFWFSKPLCEGLRGDASNSCRASSLDFEQV